MKGQFPQFDPGAAVDYREMWETSLFVFDTSVLLNLYRYQVSTRDQLLKVLEKLSDRIWLPHHAALEFQRNRSIVIADQNNRFSEVRSVVAEAESALKTGLEQLQLDRRHSLIDPEPLVSGFNELTKDFLASLERIQENQQKLTSPDPLKEKIETLFIERVGPEASEQTEIDKIYQDAEERYRMEIPPGYLDAKKDKNGPAEYVHGDLRYKRKYGDYLVWKQLLSYTKANDVKSVVFVTDDAKDDWWWKVKSDGPKTLGPRPELRDEASRVGQIKQFGMYNSEGFLTFSKEFLQPEISNAAIEEVRDVSSIIAKRSKKYRTRSSRAEIAVSSWLLEQYGNVDTNQQGFPDFVVEKNGQRFGFEVKYISNPGVSMTQLQDLMYLAEYETTKGALESVSIVFTCEDDETCVRFLNNLHKRGRDALPSNVAIWVGTIRAGKSGADKFVPITEIAGDKVLIL